MKKIISIITVMILVLSGCSTEDEQKEVLIWNPFTGADGTIFQQMVTNYNETNEEGYFINSQTYGEEYYDKISTTSQTGDQPDITIMHIDKMPYYAYNDIIVPWQQEDIDTMGIDFEDYSANLQDAAKYDGEVYSIPFDVHPYVWWVNLDLIDEDSIPTTWEELDALSQESSGDYKTVCTSESSWMLYASYIQNGVPIVSDDGSTALYNTPEAEKILQTYQDYMQEDYSMDPGAEAQSSFLLGDCGMFPDGVWSKSAVLDAGIENYTLVPMGTTLGNEDSTPATWSSSHTFVQLNKEVDEEKQAAIDSFVKYMLDNSVEWAEAGMIPASNSVLDSQEFKDMTQQYELSQNMSEFVFYPNTITQQAIWDPMSQTFEEVYLNQKSPQDALDEAENEANLRAAEVLE